MTLVWWVPEEYWRVSFARNPAVTEAQTEEFVSVLRPYTVVAVVDGKIGVLGGVTFTSEADIRAGIEIRDRQGTPYPPLSEDTVDAKARNSLAMMKPILANMLGPMGENMNFLFFPAKDQKDQSIAGATEDGAFSVKLGEREFRWRLPLSSLLPPKTCPRCKEECSGAWKFCPWCGAKLPERKE